MSRWLAYPSCAILLSAARHCVPRLVPQDFGEHSDAVWSVGASQGALAARVMQLMTVQQPQQQQGPHHHQQQQDQQQLPQHTQHTAAAGASPPGPAAPPTAHSVQHGQGAGRLPATAHQQGGADGEEVWSGRGAGQGEKEGEEDDDEALAFGDPRRRALLAEGRRRRELMERASRPEEVGHGAWGWEDT